MKTLNPFNAPGSPAAEQEKRRRERLKIGVAAFVAVNVVLFVGLLIQGCQRDPASRDAASAPVPDAGTLDTNAAVVTDQKSETNAYATPSFQPASTNAIANVDAATNSLAPLPPMATTEYRVAKGDSFQKIAKAKRISEQALAEANPGVDRAKLKVGQVLHVPQSTEPEVAAPEVAAPAKTASAPAAAKATIAKTKSTKSEHARSEHSKSGYTVKRGDTLSRIAKAHGTTVKALMLANGLTSDRIAVGKTLTVPSSKKSATSTT